MARPAHISNAEFIAAMGGGVRQTKPAALGRGYQSSAYGTGGFASLALKPLGFARSVAQGACAGLLTLLGAIHLAGAVPEENRSLETITELGGGDLDSIFGAIAGGGLPGVVEIVGAIALFLNAGRGIGRVLGLLGFVAIAAAHAQGVEHAEMASTLLEFAERARDYIMETFPALAM